MPGPICIITPSGMICETTSYDLHKRGTERARGRCRRIKDGDDEIPKGLKKRVTKLIDKAREQKLQPDKWFMIVSRP